MNRSLRYIVILGQGAATGLIAGGVIGAWEVWLNDDLTQRMFRLAAHRVVRPMVIGGAWGMAASAGLAILMSSLARRGRRLFGAGIACAALLWAAWLAALAFPLREDVLPMHRYSPVGLTRAVFGFIAAASLLLLIWRSREAIGRFDRAAPVRSGSRVPSVAFAGAAIAITVLGAAGVPRLTASRAADRPSIILISVDTLRADRLGVLGNTRSLTPFLDRLAAEGALFEQATSPAPWTLPAHVSLFTSRLPHDLRRHWDFSSSFHVRWTALAERFFDAGYRTAGFTGGGYVSKELGFSQGFEVYEEHDETLAAGPEGIASAALAWARSVGDAPFFLFVHTYEAHYPYIHAHLAQPSDAGRLPPTVTMKEVEAIHSGRLVLTPAERRYVTDLYDGDVAHADRVVGGFLSALEQAGILDRALVVLFSDHGEELWDREPHYSPDHGHSLYQELVHVPLLFRWPGRITAGGRIRAPVSLIDVAPTLLEMAGLPPDPAHQGRSMATTLLTGEEPEPRPILSESVQYGPDRFLMRTGDLKVVLTPYPDRLSNSVPIPARPLEVFDLRADPGERRDLSSHLTDPAAESVDLLWQRARRVLSDAGRTDSDDPPLPEELLEQLRSLGYLR